MDGVDESLAVLKEYHMLREDLDSLIELTTWPGKKSAFDSVEGKVKAALTRAYNKEVTPYSYSATAAVKKTKVTTDDVYGDDEEGEQSEDEQESTVDNDVLIKAKKRPAAAAASTSKGKAASKTTATKTAGTSRGKGSKAK